MVGSFLPRGADVWGVIMILLFILFVSSGLRAGVSLFSPCLTYLPSTLPIIILHFLDSFGAFQLQGSIRSRFSLLAPWRRLQLLRSLIRKSLRLIKKNLWQQPVIYEAVSARCSLPMMKNDPRKRPVPHRRAAVLQPTPRNKKSGSQAPQELARLRLVPSSLLFVQLIQTISPTTMMDLPFSMPTPILVVLENDLFSVGL